MEDNNELDINVTKLKDSKDNEGISQLINDYMLFIVKTVADSKNSYVEIENDEELSIGLIAFNEAIQKYSHEKGAFIPFAKLVILSRLKDYYRTENKNKNKHISIESIDEVNLSLQPENNDDEELAAEIAEFEKELNKFGIDFVFLAKNTPKHKDTREKALETARKVSQENDLVTFTFEKRRLPIQKIAERFFVSVKFLKGSKYLIIASLIVIVKKYTLLSQWIKKN